MFRLLIVAIEKLRRKSEEGKVKEEDKEGSDEADKAPEQGVHKELEHLNFLGWKYSARMKAYIRFMSKIHDFIINVRKGQKALHEK